LLSLFLSIVGTPHKNTKGSCLYIIHKVGALEESKSQVDKNSYTKPVNTRTPIRRKISSPIHVLKRKPIPRATRSKNVSQKKMTSFNDVGSHQLYGGSHKTPTPAPSKILKKKKN
jgi:hypothetical protein